MCRLVATLLLACLAGCALSAPPAGEWLDGRKSAGTELAPDLAELDRLAGEALAASEQRPDDVELELAASKALFQAADLRFQSGCLAALDALPDATLEQVLRADERIADALRTEILSQATAGLAAAERAAGARPNDVAAALLRGQHLALIAWANGPARSLFAGLGPKLVAAIDAAVAADPTFDHGAPLRLQGRFRSQAPRPFGDLKLARPSLARACELAPIAVNRLFHGDALWAAGEHDAARAEWQAASTADGDDSTRASNASLQELARRRLAALARSAAVR
ncbi:MAG: hypothetical protein IT453_21605 [Planctomycetes bacterium]|nr:hypothetical protein [Planctomycetota bacterium]